MTRTTMRAVDKKCKHCDSSSLTTKALINNNNNNNHGAVN